MKLNFFSDVQTMKSFAQLHVHACLKVAEEFKNQNEEIPC